MIINSIPAQTSKREGERRTTQLGQYNFIPTPICLMGGQTALMTTHNTELTSVVFLSCAICLGTEGPVLANPRRIKWYWVTVNTNESVANYFKNIRTL
jgi:hypothetical protein